MMEREDSLWPSGHSGTGILGTEFRDRSIDQVDAVKEVNNMDSDPVIQILIAWQLDSIPQIQSGFQRGFGLLVETVSQRSWFKLFLRSECLFCFFTFVRFASEHVKSFMCGMRGRERGNVRTCD